MRIGTLFQRPAAMALRGFSGNKLPPIVQPLMRARFIADTRSPTHARRRQATRIVSSVHPAACAKLTPVCSVVARDAAAAALVDRHGSEPLSMIARRKYPLADGAASRPQTLPAPADWPAIVTRLGSPP